MGMWGAKPHHDPCVVPCYTDTSSMKNSFSVPMPVLFGAGLLLCGIFTLLAYNTYFLDGRNPADSIPTTTGQEAEELSVFERHYVGAGHKIVRIPHTFCPFAYLETEYAETEYADYSRTGENLPARCPEQAYIELDLVKHPLPVKIIRSAVANRYGEIFYTTETNTVHPVNGCVISDIFSYNKETKETVKLNTPESLWTCGAATSYLSSASDGGRYLRTVAVGTHGGWGGVFDSLQGTVDEELTPKLDSGHAFITLSLPRVDANTDAYSLYTGECQDDALDEGIGRYCLTAPMLMLRDNTSGTTVRLTALEDRLRRQNIDAKYDLIFDYTQRTGVLRVIGVKKVYEEEIPNSDDNVELVIPNFDKDVRRLLP